jgi:hypothetical protein
MFTVFALIDGHFLLTLELEIIDGDIRVCHPKMWARHFVGKIFVFIDALKYSAIPFCILLILSILIIQRVFRAQDISAQLQNLRQLHNYRHYSTSSSPSCTTHSSTIAVGSTQTNLLSGNTRVGRRVTFMLLSVSIAFCVFSAPMSLMQIVQSIVKPGYHETPLAIGKAIAELCQYVNHSCNFFLYALTGRIFRREFVRLFFPTRFGSRRGLTGGNGIGGMNGMGLSARAGLIPKAAPSSSHRGSSYSIDNNRYDVNLQRSSRALYPLSYKKPQNHQSHRLSRPYLSSNNSPIIINQLNYLNDEKSSTRNNRTRYSLMNFRNLFRRNNPSRTTRDGSLLFLKALKSNTPLPSTV